MNNIDYLILCDSMTPSERLQKGFELSEWSILTNKYIDFQIEQLLLNTYLLK